MNRLFLVLLCFGLTTKTLLAQQSKYDIAVSYGFYQAPNYKQAVNKPFLAADFDYHLTKHWTISTGFLYGQFDYFDDYRSNYFSYEDYTNAKGYETHAYLTAAYSIVATNRFTLQLGSGVGLVTQRIRFPFQAPTSYGSPGIEGGTIFPAEISFSEAEIPIRLEAFYMPIKWIGVGIKAGTFLQSNRPLSGTYFGPQLRVRL